MPRSRALRTTIALAISMAILGMSFVAPSAMLASAPTGFEPATVDVNVVPTVPGAPLDKTLYVPDVLPKLDLVIAVDTTGSMIPVTDSVKASISDMITKLQAAGASDLAIAVLNFEDYPTGTPYPASENCGYNPSGVAYGYGPPSYHDQPYKVARTVTTDFASVQSAVSGLVKGNGGDGPQDYSRIMWESGQDSEVPAAPALSLGSQPALGYRDGTQKILLLFGDSMPHDCSLGAGKDPGRDGVLNTTDDITLASATQSMKDKGVKLVMVYAGGKPAQLDAWKTIAEVTGGNATQFDPSASLADLVTNQIAAIKLNVSVTRSCPTGADVRFNNSTQTGAESLSYSDVTPGDSISFTETPSLAAFTPPGTVLTCTVTATAETSGSTAQTIGTETVHIHSIPKSVRIDVKPGSLPNSINLGSKGNVPVALLGSSTFNANSVQDSSVRFRAGSCTFAQSAAFGLGVSNLTGTAQRQSRLYHVPTNQFAEPQPGDFTHSTTVAHLNGYTTAGMPWCGTDSVRIVPQDRLKPFYSGLFLFAQTLYHWLTLRNG